MDNWNWDWNWNWLAFSAFRVTSFSASVEMRTRSVWVKKTSFIGWWLSFGICCMFNATSKVADCFSWRRSVSTFSLAKRNGIYRFAALVLSQNGAEAFLYLRWMISFIYHLHLLAVSFHFTFFYLFFLLLLLSFFLVGGRLGSTWRLSE